MESYQGILTRMEEAYRAETGQEVTAVSDLGLRLRVLAGELFRLEGELEWLGRQAFPQPGGRPGGGGADLQPVPAPGF